MNLTVGSLFSGIGGLDLGLERAGMRVIWQSEIDPYANRVLKKHWPEVPNLGNIKEINWADVVRPDVLCGGYPCQPFSTAGKRRGEEDPRHLWPWVRDAISALRPRYAILENVRGHLTLGGSTVLGELADIGYDAEWRVVSAASVGANHRRDRIIIVAYPNNSGSHRAEINPAETGEPSFGGFGGRGADVAYPNNAGSGTPRRGLDGHGSPQKQERRNVAQSGSRGRGADVANPNGAPGQQQRQRQVQKPHIGGRGADVPDTARGDGGNAEPQGLRTVYGQAAKLGKQTGLCGSIASWWETEPDVGRVAHGVPARVDRLRGLGNAVVPQVAEVIGRLVVEHAAHN